MAEIEYWIQLESNPWDLSPGNLDRMKGQPVASGSVPVPMKSPVTGATTTRQMFKPLTGEAGLHRALILRRYTKDWVAPDDRKVNPWDVNELDPTDAGTMGTIPGPVIECKVGDSVKVHFRNLDLRRASDGQLLPVGKRTHSLHPHGFVFERFSDGAYPLSPPDPNQPVGPEAAAWNTVGVSDLKQGDRVPPPSGDDPVATAATYTYEWNTFGWPTTAGVWLYHDHSVCDMDNVIHGAIGIIVIHNEEDEQDVDIRDPDDPTRYLPEHLPGGVLNGSPIRTGDDGPTFVDPPKKALYVQLYHELGHGSGMCINGRKFLGNTPTILAGVETLMRFGVVGMNMDAFHTFHLHGHRWVIPGPTGNTPTQIQSSPMAHAVSQFEDTRLFGPANSFVFTVDERGLGATGELPSFMRAGGPSPELAKGEWHMHCHVLMHMDDGMMGSLVVADGGDPAVFQSATLFCEDDTVPVSGNTVVVTDFQFTPSSLTIPANSSVTFIFQGGHHTVRTTQANNAMPITINNGPNETAVTTGDHRPVTIAGAPGGFIKYECGRHPDQMKGEIHLT
jgi:FtsP/CotA-like multicopper oxidase with cupredoxin domain/plastocyanin